MRQFCSVHAIITTASIAFILAVTIVPMNAQDIPLHVQPSVQANGGSSFDYGANLYLFDSLAAYAAGISVNVSQHNFAGADANFAQYINVVSEFDKLNLTNPEDIKLINSIGLSKEDYRQLIADAKQFETLSNQQAVLSATNPTSPQSLQNMRELQRISSDLHSLMSTIDARNKDIYQNARVHGLDTAPLDRLDAALGTYVDQSNAQVSNVTNAVFRNAQTTLQADRGAGTYLDVIQFSGRVLVNGAGISNSSVDIAIDNASVATVTTNATGDYEYAYTIEHIKAGAHDVMASFEAPTIPSTLINSSVINVNVTAANVTNVITSTSGKTSLLGGYEVKGVITAGDRPVKNASLLLYLDNKSVAKTMTDGEGKYVFTYHASAPDYFASVAIGPARHSVYTLFDPGDLPLNGAKSGVYAVAVDPSESYVALIGGITAAFVVVIAYLTVVRKKSRKAVDVTAGEHVEGIGDEVSGTPEGYATVPHEELERERIAEPEPGGGIDDLIKGATSAMEEGNFNDAVTLLYEGALRVLSETGSIDVTSDMTHWETLSAIENSVPALSTHMRTLTYLFELANYSGKQATREHVNAAIRELTAVYDNVMSGRGGGGS